MEEWKQFLTTLVMSINVSHSKGSNKEETTIPPTSPDARKEFIFCTLCFKNLRR
jgi:hypothetical protein